MNPLKLVKYYKLYNLYKKGIKNKQLFKDYKYWAEFFKLLFSLKEFREMLAGYKSYIVAILMGMLVALKSLGYIDEQTFQNLMALLTAGAVGAVRAAINKVR